MVAKTYRNISVIQAWHGKPEARALAALASGVEGTYSSTLLAMGACGRLPSSIRARSTD